jgi:hypothetical protein
MSFRLTACLALALAAACGLGVPTPADAQVGSRAYAPENLRQFSVQDRVRIIDREYQDQSGGRRIPDDQLEFYLDQINSGWTFSQIQQDISTSLRGNGNDGWRPNPGWSAREVICSSDNNRYRECRTPFRGRARITQQISDTSCREGRNWGWRNGMVWVNGGCRARFGDAGGIGGPGNGQNQVTCASQDRRFTTCAWNSRYGRPRLLEQQSDAACREGYSWGYDGRGLWVDKGCRGRFGN